ncbi:MAG: CheR family methyltransferase [Solirubrobacterales bacterium]
MSGPSDGGGLEATMDGYEDTVELARLAELIQQVTGFRDGPSLRGKLRTIVGASEDERASGWLQRLGRGWISSSEWQALLDRLLVPETFFFRDLPQLDVLRQHVLPGIIAAKRSGTRSIRVWSAGCSTGEEPYTLAMLVLDALVAAGEATEMLGGAIHPASGWSVSVSGTDISARVVDKARAGIYSDFGLSPFRDTPQEYRRFFVPKDGDGAISRFTVRNDVRSVTSFSVHNIKDGALGTDFDIVSCRNVMIYFDDAHKRVALGNLAQALAPDGFMLLGPTDPFDVLPGFQLVDPRISPILAKRPAKR